MLPHEIPAIIPENPRAVAEEIQTQQLTRNFYQEVRYREDFANYCQWYYETARKHQQEYQVMKQDINILGWFQRYVFGRDL